MARTTRSTPNPTHRTSARVVVATVVVALVGALVTLAGGAGERPIAPSLRPVLLVGAGLPTPPALVVGALEPAAGATAPEGSGAVDAAPEVEAAATGAPTHLPPTPSAPAAVDPAPPPVPAAPPTTEPPMPEQPPIPSGTLEIQVTPAPSDGSSRQVAVETNEGAQVLERTEVTGPIVLELTPGTYVVLISTTGPPYGPDEDGIALGGGSSVTRDLAEVVAGGTTTVTCSTC